MSLTLDPQTEQRIQRLVDLGHYQNADEFISTALEPYEWQQDWLSRNKQAINERLDVSMAQAARGELYTPEEARRILAERRGQRSV